VPNPLDVVVSSAHHANQSLDWTIASPAWEDAPFSTDLPTRNLNHRLLSWSRHVLIWVDLQTFSVHVIGMKTCMNARSRRSRQPTVFAPCRAIKTSCTITDPSWSASIICPDSAINEPATAAFPTRAKEVLKSSERKAQPSPRPDDRWTAARCS
jgi:hypothetical protein